MKKICGRDIRFFLLGVLAMLLFVIAYDWEEFKQGFQDGYNDTRGNTTEQVEASATSSTAQE